MTSRFLAILLSSLCLSSLSTMAQAEDYYSDQSPGSGYSSSNSGGYPANSTNYYSATEHHPEHRKERNRFTFSVGIAQPNEVIVVREHRPHHNRELQWIPMSTGYPIPQDAVISGSQPAPAATLFACRASYNGGLHPGKLYDGRCNISWGGNELSLSRYEILVSHRPLTWIPANNGYIPDGAIEGGYENGQPLYICQARYHGGRHSGKVVGQACNVGWGGREISIPYYNVLVR